MNKPINTSPKKGERIYLEMNTFHVPPKYFVKAKEYMNIVGSFGTSGTDDSEPMQLQRHIRSKFSLWAYIKCIFIRPKLSKEAINPSVINIPMYKSRISRILHYLKINV